MNDPFLYVSGQEPSTSSKYPPFWPPIPDTFLIKISTRNFQGIFLSVKKTSSMISRITQSSKALVRNRQHPPSTPFLTNTSSLGSNKIIYDIKDDPGLQFFSQEPSTSSKYPYSWSPLLDTLPVKISIWKFQGIFLGVYQDHPRTIRLLGRRPKRWAEGPPNSPP